MPCCSNSGKTEREEAMGRNFSAVKVLPPGFPIRLVSPIQNPRADSIPCYIPDSSLLGFEFIAETLHKARMPQFFPAFFADTREFAKRSPTDGPVSKQDDPATAAEGSWLRLDFRLRTVP